MAAARCHCTRECAAATGGRLRSRGVEVMRGDVGVRARGGRERVGRGRRAAARLGAEGGRQGGARADGAGVPAVGVAGRHSAVRVLRVRVALAGAAAAQRARPRRCQRAPRSTRPHAGLLHALSSSEFYWRKQYHSEYVHNTGYTRGHLQHQSHERCKRSQDRLATHRA